MQVFQRQSQVFGESAIVRDDAEHGPPRAMRFQPAAAEVADRFEAIRRTRNIDLTGYPPPQPFSLRRTGNALHILDLPDKLMSGRSAEVVVTAKDFHVGVANPGEANANERPALSQFWPRLRGCFQFSVYCAEGEHEVSSSFSFYL